jgi:hypothetical protein
MNRDDIIRMAHEAGFSDIVKKGVWITDGFWDEELERFAELVAELVVKECLEICKEKEQANLYGVREVENTIKQHFGVE